MRRLKFVLASLVCIVALALMTAGFASAAAQDERLDAPKLKTVIEGLGYEVTYLNKEEGKEKFQFKVTKSGFDIPIAAEFSASKNYIWLTVFLGASKPTLKFEEMLKQNFKIQPCLFYITEKGNLMMGIATDNRSVSPAVMKRNLEKLAEDAANTSELWSDK